MDVAHWAEGKRPPLLVIHDLHDGVVPWGHGDRIRAAWNHAELITTEGLGHRRVRKDDDVIRRAVSFLEGAPGLADT
jgi:pimeloyl-ACP methyl ester carboxylesterase